MIKKNLLIRLFVTLSCFHTSKGGSSTKLQQSVTVTASIKTNFFHHLTSWQPNMSGTSESDIRKLIKIESTLQLHPSLCSYSAGVSDKPCLKSQITEKILENVRKETRQCNGRVSLDRLNQSPRRGPSLSVNPLPGVNQSLGLPRPFHLKALNSS